MGAQDLIENIKYADGAMKKKIALGSLAGVLFILAGVFLLRAMLGGPVEELPTETEQAMTELRQQLTAEGSTQTEVEDPEPFSRQAQPMPR